MTRSSSGGVPAAQSSSAFSPSTFRQRKVPRERLVRLAVEADICPQVLLRVLGLVAQHSLVPLAIGYESKDQGLVFEVIVDGLSDHAAETLRHRVAGLATVRSAELFRVPPA